MNSKIFIFLLFLENISSQKKDQKKGLQSRMFDITNDILEIALDPKEETPPQQHEKSFTQSEPHQQEEVTSLPEKGRSSGDGSEGSDETTTGPPFDGSTEEENPPTDETPEESTTEGESQSTGESSFTTSKPSKCDDDNDSADTDLDLKVLCAGCCSAKRLIPNPNSEQTYIECNGGQNNDKHSIRKCSPGLLFDRERLSCDYAGLVNPEGPKRRF